MKRYELANRNNLFWPFGDFLTEFDRWPLFIDSNDRGSPAVDIQEHDDRYVIKADIPGYEKEEIDIRLENDILTLSAQRNEEVNKETDGYLRRERRSTSLTRSIRFVKAIDGDQVKADYINGVLTVELPKANPGNTSRKIDLQ